MFNLIFPLALAATQPMVQQIDAASTATRRNEATSSARIVVRIIKSSASIGPGYAAPASGAAVRATTVAGADGRQAPAIITEFE